MTENIQTETVTGGQSHYVSHCGNRIHYITVGKGSHVIVFIHGWCCKADFWREQIPALKNKARLILIDLPGHGQSDKPQTNYTMDFFAGAVLAVLQDAEVDKAIFIGHSMGGAVMAQVYHRAPEKFTTLVSVDGLLRRLEGAEEDGRALLGGFMSPHYQEHARKFISTFFPVPGTEKLCECVTSEMLLTPQHVMFGAMLAMLSPEQPDWILQRVNAPLIVINSRTSWWNAAYETYVRSLTPQAEYLTLDGIGHFLMLEKPAEFNAILLEKLAKFDSIPK